MVQGGVVQGGVVHLVSEARAAVPAVLRDPPGGVACIRVCGYSRVYADTQRMAGIAETDTHGYSCICIHQYPHTLEKAVSMPVSMDTTVTMYHPDG